MTTLTNWISPGTMQSLGWALVHFLWQGTALAALAAAAMAVCRRPSVRYLIGVGALGLMLLGPAATFFYAQQHASSVEFAKSSSLTAADRPIARGNTAVSGATQPRNIWSLNALPWLVKLWLVGVALFSLRSAGGFVLVERQRRRASSVVKDWVLETCYSLQDQLGIHRAIQYCESVYLQTPAVIGWFRPIVFLPASALTGLSEEQLRLVIAHELAHIRRFDAFVNVFQVCAETLLFYHPAVWWLNRRIRAEREHCCDETAVALCGNAVEYARALTLMEEWRSAPVLAMAANRGPLSERIVHLLGLSAGRGNGRKLGFGGGVLFFASALLAGNALLAVAYPKPAVLASMNPIRTLMQRAVPQAQPAPRPTPAAKPSAGQLPQHSDQPVNGQSYIEAMTAAGLTNLTADQLIALKIQDITPEYVREMHDLGLHPGAEGFVGMRVQGVTPDYVKELRSLGFNPDVDQIVGMKVQGITPEYIRELQSVGLKPDGNQVVGLKVQGVTAAYIKGLQEQGLSLSVEEVIGMRVQDVTPEYVHDIRALGLSPTAEQIVGMKVQDVTPQYIKALQSAGFKLDVDKVIGAKVQGVTPEFIDAARKHGFQNLTLDKLIQLKHLGILENQGDI